MRHTFAIITNKWDSIIYRFLVWCWRVLSRVYIEPCQVESFQNETMWNIFFILSIVFNQFSVGLEVVPFQKYTKKSSLLVPKGFLTRLCSSFISFFFIIKNYCHHCRILSDFIWRVPYYIKQPLKILFQRMITFDILYLAFNAELYVDCKWCNGDSEVHLLLLSLNISLLSISLTFS